ncbi:hypothetical protein [Parasphingorhabdus sp.]|uniref:hypothetical protein n=1 Tax=Parasphingorhabdus sp. TaxID=2709688 RepID=UPI0035930D8A
MALATFRTKQNETAFEADIETPLATVFEAEPEVRRDRYNLATALGIIRRMETSSARSAVFAEIKNKNPVYRLVDTLYAKAGYGFLQPLVLFIYMLKSVLSLGKFDYSGHEAVAISNFQNEHNAINRLVALLPGTRVMMLSPKLCNLFSRDQLRTTISMIGAAPRVFPFLSRLARSYGFMPSARMASGLAYYIRFSQLLARHPGMSAAIVASNYSPEALGLSAAAHNKNRKVVYVNHAPVPANGAMVPPVLADCAVFYGNATRSTYERESRCNAEVALIGQPGTARPMEWRDEIRTLGIFLTALTCAKSVEKLVTTISESRPGLQILIRNHPVALLKSDFSDLAAKHKNVKITIGNPLEDEIAACDLILCGNSGVAMNVLREGRPVAYLDSLDKLNHDYCGFIQSRLVCDVKNWSGDLYPMIKAFYTRPDWQRVMKDYDASYNSDISQLEYMAAQTILRYVSSKPDRG